MDLNTILIILGVIALVALVAHGLWANRREKSTYFKNANAFNRNSINSERTKYQPSIETTLSKESEEERFQVSSEFDNPQNNVTTETDYRYSEKTIDDIKISIPGTTPVYPMGDEPKSSEQYPAYETMIDNGDEANSSTAELEELQQIPNTTPNQYQQIQAKMEKVQTQHSGFVMLYIVAEQNREFSGQYLAQSLENLGFIFGDKQMFHRHLDLSVSSPVLFSVANIQQPGTFDFYNMADSSTMGIVLFMELPSIGNDLANLRMMIRAAKTLAEDLNGIILTDQKEIFDEQAEQTYLAKVA
ncbi:cell division protein ZipA [Rodentibacter caecimuris]|uniref:Cell division protein ZipA n=1 Tax=Rodentibacter caecimuris TaxID=1796644 RepID=A0ABX3L0V2_9PAST|nr:cell division protein ZipA [Rodentibacter heylii]